jgi:hypothetical protein
MIRAIGIDAAFANMGLARVIIHNHGIVSGPRFSGKDVECDDLTLISTDGQHGKTVRKSSDDLRRARILYEALRDYAQGSQIAFAEVPSGAQSAAAAKALGTAVGIIASCPIPLIEVNPQEVKAAVRGRPVKGNASIPKADIIAWAVGRWPKAPWVRHERNGKNFMKGDLQNCNEHLADALAVIAAGIATPAFQQLIALQSHATPSTVDSGPTPRRRPFV